MHIAILTGGISTERAIALLSSENLQEWCTHAGYVVDRYDCPNELEGFIQKHKIYDLVIPVFHGIYGEDGQITAFLKSLDCHYAYSDFGVHNLCIDKNLTNLSIQEIDILIPRTTFVKRGKHLTIPTQNTLPAIIKPNHGGSSISTKRVTDEHSLLAACQRIVDDDILIQECIEGREFTVGVYRDSSGFHTLPIIEIRTLSEDFFDYSEKYETDGSNEVFMTGEVELQKRLQDESLRVCEYIGTKGVVRLDWRYDGKDIYFLEVNTIPGFTTGSLVPKMWKKAGKTEWEFVEMLSNEIQ